MFVSSTKQERGSNLNLRIIRQSSQVRCYRCGDPQIRSVCHHCGRAMCKIHTPKLPPKKVSRTQVVQSSFIHKIILQIAQYITKLLAQLSRSNQEFMDLELSETPMGEMGIHCHYCIHYDWPYFSYFLIALTAFTAMIITAFKSWVTINIGGLVFSLFMAFISLSTGVICLVLTQRQDSVNYKKRPLFPLLGKITHVNLSEAIQGKATLDKSGRYSETILSQRERGKIEITVRFTLQDRDVLQAYRNKYRLNYTHMIPFSMGFFAIKGFVDLRFDSSAKPLQMMNIIELSGYIREQPFFTEFKAGRDSFWERTYPYTYSLISEKRNGFPVQIVPAIVNEGEKWGIEVTIQIKPNQKIEDPVIKNFTLKSESILGKVIRTRPAGMYQLNPVQSTNTVNTTRWEDIPLDEGDDYARHKTFYIRFENTIKSTSSFSGTLQIVFRDTLSDVQDVSFFYPLGNERKIAGHVIKQTNVDLDFNFNVDALRFTKPISCSTSMTQEGVIPDHKIVTLITDAISENQIYVQRIIENPPRTNRADATILNRFWDIAGRSYKGVFPVDFHLVLTGQEWYEGADQPAKGITKIDITVQAITTDNDMSEYVENVFERLTNIVEDKLQANCADHY